MTKDKLESFCLSTNTVTRARGQLIADELYGGNFSTYVTNLINLDFNSKKHLFPTTSEDDYIKKLELKKAERKSKRKSKQLENTDKPLTEPSTISDDDNKSSETVADLAIESSNVSVSTPNITENSSNTLNKEVIESISHSNNESLDLADPDNIINNPIETDEQVEPDEQDLLNAY